MDQEKRLKLKVGELPFEPDSWEGLLREYEGKARTGPGADDFAGAGIDRLDRYRRPQDAQAGRMVSLYLRADVVAWLKQEAERRGNGWSASRIVVDLVRAEIARPEEETEP